MIVLGIETACDDTAVAVVRDGHEVLANVVLTEPSTQTKWGGVVPELAARAQLELFTPALDRALEDAGVTLGDVDAVAVNNRHGLLRSIVVGVAAAKSLSYTLGVPLIPIHHIEGHIYSALIDRPDVPWPHVCLTVSGGHNLILHAVDHGKYELIGRTLDDAAGEAYDKLARRLGLGFPGGPLIDRLAAEGDATAYDLPRPKMDDGTYDFSFSGLKTAVTRLVDECEARGEAPVVEDVAASFQAAVVDVLVSKVVAAARDYGSPVVTIAGGVAANSGLRDRLTEVGGELGFEAVVTPRQYCTDNAAMVACAAHYRGVPCDPDASLGLEASSNFPLGDLEVNYGRGAVPKA